MVGPVAAAVAVVEQERLQIVHRVGKVRLGGLVGLKFVKNSHQPAFLVVRQERINALLCRVLARLLRLQTVGVVGVGVTCVNLHHIVQQAHEHDARHIHRLVGIFLQQIRHDSHVPCVLGVVLAAAVAGEMRLPENVLLLVDLENEIQLFLQPFVHKSIFLSI